MANFQIKQFFPQFLVDENFQQIIAQCGGVDVCAFYSKDKQQAKGNQTIENESKEPYLTETKIKCFLIV